MALSVRGSSTRPHPKSKHSPKTAKRLEIKRVMLEAKAAKKGAAK